MLGLASALFGGIVLAARRLDPAATAPMTAASAALFANAPLALLGGGILLWRGGTSVRFSLPVPP
jgi:hypothetical protein